MAIRQGIGLLSALALGGCGARTAGADPDPVDVAPITPDAGALPPADAASEVALWCRELVDAAVACSCLHADAGFVHEFCLGTLGMQMRYHSFHRSACEMRTCADVEPLYDKLFEHEGLMPRPYDCARSTACVADAVYGAGVCGVPGCPR